MLYLVPDSVLRVGKPARHVSRIIRDLVTGIVRLHKHAAVMKSTFTPTHNTQMETESIKGS